MAILKSLTPDHDYVIKSWAWVEVGGITLRISEATEDGGVKISAWDKSDGSDENSEPISTIVWMQR